MSDENAPIPYERFQKVNEAKKAAEARLAEIEGKLTQLDALTSRAAELETALSTANKTTARLTATMDTGIISKEGRDLADYCYSRIEGNKPEFSEWLAAQRDAPAGLMRHAWKLSESRSSGSDAAPAANMKPAEPSPVATAPVETPTAPVETPTAPQPNVNGAAIPSPRVSPGYNAETIRGMTSSQYAAQREAILASFRGS